MIMHFTSYFYISLILGILSAYCFLFIKDRDHSLVGCFLALNAVSYLLYAWEYDSEFIKAVGYYIDYGVAIVGTFLALKVINEKTIKRNKINRNAKK